MDRDRPGQILRAAATLPDRVRAGSRDGRSARVRLANPRTIDNRGLAERVVHQIGQEIVSGSLEPGRTLPNEAELCQQLGVSRSVLREAVRVLVSKGLIETRSRLGTRVRLPDAWSLLDPAVLTWLSAVEPQDRFVRELFGLRRVVEPAVAALAAECIVASDLAALEASFEDMIEAGDDPERFFGPDLRFHQTILLAVGNSLVRALGEMVNQAMEFNLRLSLEAPLGQQKSIPLHRAVLEAIRDRRPDAARDAMTRLIDDAEQDVWHALAAKRKAAMRRRRK
jgi:DNA-binding FadR family transcriptional regulator